MIEAIAHTNERIRPPFPITHSSHRVRRWASDVRKYIRFKIESNYIIYDIVSKSNHKIGHLLENMRSFVVFLKKFLYFFAFLTLEWKDYPITKR